MAIIQTIDSAYELEQAFKAYGRSDNFSPEGLRQLFNYLDDMDTNYELDVVELCCDYREFESIDDFMQEHGEYSGIDIEEFSSAGEDEQLDMIREYLEHRTSVVCCDDGCIMFRVF